MSEWCVRIVATGGVLIQLCTRKNPALSKTPAKYIVRVRHEVYGMSMLRSIWYAYVMKYGVWTENWFAF